jgi:glycosyltransferase involved in cell wall biosynthesis
MWILFLKIIFIASTIIQLAYWLILFRKLAFHTESETIPAESEMPVSVIICARNESYNLNKNLYSILNQDYTNFELIVVNDNSTDDSSMVLEQLRLQYPEKLRLLTLTEKTTKGKKGALSEGILAAKNDILLLTDADCTPISPKWITTMVHALTEDKSIVLGYSPYEYVDGFLNLFIRYETLWTAVQYLSFALAGMPYMGVGRNLMYRKKLFIESNGFQVHKHILSGDDDLFINQVATKTNTTICIQQNAHVLSEPKYHVTDWVKQKSRHFGTGHLYHPKHQYLLGMLTISQFFYFVSFFFLFVLGFSTIFENCVFITRTSIVWFLYAEIIKKLRTQRILKSVMWLEGMMPLFYLFFTPIVMQMPLSKRATHPWK